MDERAADKAHHNSARAPAARSAVAPGEAGTPWGLLLLLMAMTAIGPTSFTLLVPAIPGLAVTLGTDSGIAQLTISLFLFSLAAAQLFAGPLADRFGRRPVAIAGLALNVAACLAALATTSITGLIIARVVQAVGAATGIVISRAILRDLFDRNRAASMIGLVAMVMAIAPTFAPLIGGVLDTAFGWRSIIAFMAAFGLIVLVWGVLKLPETRTPLPHGEQPAGFVADLKALGANASFHGYVLAGGLGSATFFAFLGGGPHIVVTIMGHTSAEYGLWFMISSLGYVGGNFIASRFAVRRGTDMLIGWGLGIQLVGVGLTLALTTLLADPGAMSIFLPQTLIAFGNGVLLPNSIAGAISVRPQAAGTAAGFTGFAQTAIGALCTQFAGYVAAVSINAIPLAVIMIVLAIMASTAFVTLVTLRKPPASET